MKYIKKVEYSIKALFCLWLAYLIYGRHIPLYVFNENDRFDFIDLIYTTTHIIPFLIIFAVIYVVKLIKE